MLAQTLCKLCKVSIDRVENILSNYPGNIDSQKPDQLGRAEPVEVLLSHAELWSARRDWEPLLVLYASPINSPQGERSRGSRLQTIRPAAGEPMKIQRLQPTE